MVVPFVVFAVVLRVVCCFTRDLRLYSREFKVLDHIHVLPKDGI